MNQQTCQVLYAKFNSTRSPAFRVTTEICEDANGLFVRKRAEAETAEAHLANIHKNGDTLEDYYRSIRVIPSVFTGKELRFPFISGQTLAEQIDISHFDKEQFIAQVNEKLETVLSIQERYVVPFRQTAEFESVFGVVELQDVQALNPANIDSLFTNFITNDTGIYCIDCEWVCPFPVPVEYIRYRILRYLYLNQVRACLNGVSLEEMLDWFGFSTQAIESCWKMERRFQQYIHGENWKYIYTEHYKKKNVPIERIDQEIEARNADLSVKMSIIRDKDVHIGNLENLIGGLRKEVHDKDYHIENLEKMTRDLQSQTINLQQQIIELQKVFYEKETHIDNLENLVEELRHENAVKDSHIRNLENLIGQLKSQGAEKDGVIRNQQTRIQQLTLDYQTISNAFFWRVTKPARVVLDAMKALARKNEIIYLLLRSIKDTMKGGFGYAKERRNAYFIEKTRIQATSNIVSEEEMERQRSVKFDRSITFSILVPLYNTPIEFLTQMIRSVQNQTYGKWELCLADGSDAEHGEVRKYCADAARADKRIKYKKLRENKGISENTNECLRMSTGEYIVLFDHDDLLHPSALYENMKAICAEEADFVYSDENTFHVDPSDAYCPHFKPDYAPDTLRSYNYICHLTVFQRGLLEKAGGGFRKQFDGSQDYDMVLRLTEQAQHIVHIPKILYYWRGHEGSVASNISAKSYTVDAAKAALAEHLKRIGLKGKVLDSSILSTYKIQYDIDGSPLISIVIPNMDHISDLKKCIDSITEKSTWHNREIVIVENNSKNAETFEYYRSLEGRPEIRVVTWKGPFNFSGICNFGAREAKGDYILLLNNDVEVITPDWIEQMLMFAQRSDIGAVGAMLFYPDNTIQHAGVILGIGGVAGHSHKYFNRGEYGYASRLTIAQNLSAVTAACCLIPRRIWEQVGGLDESFAVAFNDVDLCMRIRKAGYLIVWTPYAELYHYESKSRGLEDTAEKQIRFKSEIDRFHQKWGDVLKKGDPYYNPNLTLEHENFSLR